ncbi:3-deoxy-D-manno-octulosonic acid transferase [Dinoroseobacter sp. PD6]|uniref:3-deoxy-D-manno-octulosonic acid transferase n=1 Tax=Dinoroseobacter sp. PD6 TaxID=3028384 RepID=UPI00237B60D0|nr:3-deoxy-D-manno-octulosonic acid transferase [Dinoroseobacter sp. PD6]MDD9717177.1 3-deoxy-D-manno-octulosonic acid transferase [Dinoroseobacter sp. PD6]
MSAAFPRSAALWLYLAMNARLTGWAERKIAERREAGKEDPDRYGERLGRPGLPRPDGPLIWMHAASVGEALSVQELIRRLREERPDTTILLTTGTRTSAELLATRLPQGAIHQFAPVDTKPAIAGFLDHWKPDLAIWIESELWPRMIHDTADRGIPMMLMNARMSPDSYRRWRWMRGLSHALLSRFRRILAQDKDTMRLLARLGAPQDRLRTIGTLKEGAQLLPYSQTQYASFLDEIDGRPLWLASSTHPGEEEMMSETHRSLVRRMHRLLMVLVPRHPERGPEIARALRAEGWEVSLRSDDDSVDLDTQIYVADTLGELGLWYRLAPVSFIGGSLTEVGGHNPFEPAALGSAIVHGPHVFNFADIYERLTQAGGARQVDGPVTLAETIDDLLAPHNAAAMAHAAWEVSSRGAQVTDLALSEVLDQLDGVEPAARKAP